jgi:hypothetical protein
VTNSELIDAPISTVQAYLKTLSNTALEVFYDRARGVSTLLSQAKRRLLNDTMEARGLFSAEQLRRLQVMRDYDAELRRAHDAQVLRED